MQRVRRLYEDGVAPVREIARLAGVTERTLYKYAAKGGWRARYGRRVLTKGAGGRFIPREDAGKPFARGIKATDPAGRAKASKVCARAQRLARRVAKEAAEKQRRVARFDTLDDLGNALLEIAKLIAETHRDKAARERTAPLQHRMLDLIERMQQSLWSSPGLIGDLSSSHKRWMPGSSPGMTKRSYSLISSFARATTAGGEA